ncbi:LLM class flavin-dependent oxidoreductase [Verrucosispora sp. SN26_14.1]|uniref:LLM class flavin-dependent oxidoreductase n=1 Tax=Verrucosispora sp. SN26_14.1 TaxID=2527879 RepID=UPI0010346E31|nr:LLM class flavin-dependent oxidoreductase [Verrucosispora sp. SN26_14.1]TBL30487.1 LLM class flavin-dependent oxidoreductase [Verrucosispora sp. SN26_14.1]
MKFGINLFPTVGPQDKPAGQYFSESLRLAELADELGFHHVKTVEHYFSPYGGYSPDPVTFLAAAAARTRRIRLVTGAVLPAFTHPVKLAGKLAMLDGISGGRLDVGFGRAFLPDEFHAFGIPLDESRARFDEGVAACTLLWTTENAVWEGRFHRFGPVTLLPRPVQQPHPRILVATAKSPESAEAAGRNGHGVMLVPSINSREQVQDVLALYRKAAAANGVTPTDEDVHMSYNAFLAEDPDEARRLGRGYSEQSHRTLADAVSAWAHTRSADYPGYEKIVERVGKGDFDRQVAAGKALVGSPEQVIAAVENIREWFGDVTLSLQVVSGNVPYEQAARSLRLFATHVLPRF